MINYCRGIASLLAGLLLSSCYPIEERHRVELENFSEANRISAPTKVHLLDGSVILCQDGFRVQRDTLLAFGTRYSISRLDSIDRKWWIIPLDSVGAMEYFDRTVRGARAAGSFLLGTTITAEIALGSLLILKAIFGSCPTVYSLTNQGEHLEAECFSYSIGRQFEMPDLDGLTSVDIREGTFHLRVKNEALETHYINLLALAYVDHPHGSEVFPTEDGSIITTGRPVPPFSATNSLGTNILESIRDRDQVIYKLDSASVGQMFGQKRKDWIDCVIPVPPNASKGTIVLRARNSLQNTILLYNVMMRDQGLKVLEWSRDVNENWWYAWQLSRWYREFSGIEVLVYDNGELKLQGCIFDTGPIAWKQTAIQFPVHATNDSIRVRLAFLPDNWDIDWVGFDFGEHQPLRLTTATCIGAKDNTGRIRSDLIESIRKDDKNYFVTYPGEYVDLSFTLPPQSQINKLNRTLFVRSKGYYVEWVRPEWIRERPDVHGFDLSDRDGIAKRLSQLWLLNRNQFENQFFNERVPSWDPGGRR